MNTSGSTRTAATSEKDLAVGLACALDLTCYG